MPTPHPVRCFLCNELCAPLDLNVDPLGVWMGEHQMRFFAHHECMRAVASPDFRFPTPEQLDEEGRELVKQMEEADRYFSQASEEEFREALELREATDEESDSG